MGNPAPRTRHLGPGSKLGKYELIRQVAVGGMAELYLARTLGIEGFEKLVVVKRILPQYVSSPSFVSMFLNEARLAATLHHPNIAQVYDIGLDEGDYFFAMEYVHGEDLDRIAVQSAEQGVPISQDAALTLIAGLCAGLHYAHEHRSPDGSPLSIVHRDVSPSNVLVSYDGGVKLVDFGIARAITGNRSSTTTGGLKGKIHYMSPEQCRSKTQLDRRSDLYSVGTLLYELTTGQPPFSGASEYAVLNQIVNDDAPPPSSVVPGYPAALERIVLKALARDRERRYSTALELQGDIEDFAHENRLRISPLVLQRLMSSLFPARREDFEQAKAQGAFFVEQHVVRTLIESGKTPDPDDPNTKALAAALAAQKVADEAAARAAAGDDDTTSISQPPVPDLGENTATEIAPVPGSITQTQPAALPPEPIVVKMIAAAPGTLATPRQGTPLAAVPSGDHTERVRAARGPSPTKLVRDKKRLPIVAIVGGIALAGGITAFVALRAGDDGKPAAQVASPPVETKTEPPPGQTSPPAPPPVETPPEPPKEVAAPPPPPPTIKSKPVESKPKPTVVAKPKPVDTKPPPADKPKPPPADKPKPPPEEPKKEQKPWNADSPFMPVRPSH